MSPGVVVLVSAATAGVLALGLPTLLRRLPEPADDPPEPSYLTLAGWRTLLPLGVAVSAIVAGLLAWRIEPSRAMIALAPLAPVLVLVAYVDWRARRLPKVPILAATGAVLVLLGLELFLEPTVRDLIRPVLGMLLARGFFWLMWRIWPSAMGFGDVRLAALVGLVLGWVGWTEWIVGLWAGLAIFGAWGIARAIVRRSRSAMREPLAYGPFMILGMLVALLAG